MAAVIQYKYEDEDTVTCHTLNNLTTNLNDTVSSSGISKTKQQEITILRHEIKVQQKYINKYQLILSCLKDVTTKMSTSPTGSKPTISAATSLKVDKIIEVEKARQFFQNCPMASHPLGLLEENVPSKDSLLLYDESADLRTAVEECMCVKCNVMEVEEKKELTLSKQCLDKTNILKLNAELNDAVLNYNDSLIQGCNIMKEICDSFVVPMAKINEVRAECLAKELRATELKAKLLECRITKKMYSENEYILPSIEIIDASLKLEMESLSTEVKKLRIHKANYDQLSEIEQYKKVFTEYQEIKKSIKDKKWLLRQC